ncbi:MAG TPA: MnmC family methyltransferase, partial [Bacteroidales bacterium]|nr:MnmC family methyltransferase [Bacteroidales bacterium]
FRTATPEGLFDLIYYDAFSPDIQPHLWQPEIFQKIADHCVNGAVLTTYSSKGIVKRALKDAGFSIEKIPGPPGKREFIRASITS